MTCAGLYLSNLTFTGIIDTMITERLGHDGKWVEDRHQRCIKNCNTQFLENLILKMTANGVRGRDALDDVVYGVF